MKNRTNLHDTICGIIVALLCTVCMQSCSDDVEDIVTPSSGDLIELAEAKLSVSAKKQYRTIQINEKKEGVTVSFRCDADWIEIQADTVASDGCVEILIDAANDGIERSAKVVFTATDGTSTETLECEIVQAEDTGDNYEEPATKTMRVGYGYNIFGAFQNDVSVMSPIISQIYMEQVNSEYNLVETTPRSVLTTEKVTARSLVEMGQLLAEKEETRKSGVTGGASKTVNVHTKSSKYEATDNQYAYIRLLKTSAMRNIDVGVLTMLMDKGEKMFTKDFEKIKNEIIASPNDGKLINKMLDTYGTHLVIQAELGATIELTVNFSRNIKGSLDMRTEDFADYFFRSNSSSFLLPDNRIEGMTNKVTVDTTCIITGGSALATKELKDNIKRNGAPTQEVLKKWLDSSSGDITSDEVAKALVPVNFKLLPIWYLFPQECVGQIIRAVNERAERSDSKIYDTYISTDYYMLELDNSLLAFGDKPDDTQVKVMYAQNRNSNKLEPVLEICYEYVPKIRGDKRIPVVYGIRRGSPFLGAGFFPGDGAGNPPAWLTFSDGDIYVLPVEDTDATDRITTLYYMHGNIYTKNYGVDVEQPRNTRVVDQYFELDKKYPIVKIGEGYWTRKNIREDMYFGEPVDPDYEYSDYYIYESMIDGMVYANIFYGNSNDLMFYHSDKYGWEENKLYGERIKWYLPKIENIHNLKTYLGDNTRALLKNQHSGFEAEFNGMYGNWDDLTGKPLPVYRMQYKGTHCFIPAKDRQGVNNGTALILDSNYNLFTSSIAQSTENCYPIRLFRTAYWIYPSIEK